MNTERLLRRRKAAGLTCHELSLRAGLSHGYVSALESGRIESPSTETIRRIAKELGVTVDELLEAEVS